MRALPAALAAAAVLPLTLLPGPAQAATLNGPFEQTVLQQINGHRDPSLHPGRCSDRYAEALAGRIARTHRIRHQSLARIRRACGVRTAAEVIAVGPMRPAGVVRAWMRSRPDRTVLRWTGFDHIGVGSRRYDSRRIVTVVVVTNR